MVFTVSMVCYNYTYAAFGESCTTLPDSQSDTYLNNTVYGYLQNNIDMTGIPNACDSGNQNFVFCLKNQTGASEICNTVTLNVGDSKYIRELGNTNPALGANPYLQDILLQVSTIGGKNCLTMPTSRGRLSLVCKNRITGLIADMNSTTSVCGASSICANANSKSKTPLNFSGTAIGCVKETLDQVFYRRGSCNADGEEISYLNSFLGFQEALKTAIRAALILYVIIFGFKIVMSNEYLELNNVVLFIFKFILVAYFAVGLGPVYFQDGYLTTHNGMLEYGLPFFSSAISSFAQMVFNAAGATGLCNFNPSEYDNGYSYLAIWDAIDCRISYYMGFNTTTITSGIFPTSTSGGGGITPELIGAGSAAIVSLVAMIATGKAAGLLLVLFGFLLAGNMIMFISILIFILLFISIVLNFITTYLVSLITLYAMTYISPIFIPMALFNRTKSYFDSWLKIVISCSLQPMVVSGFMALLLSIYDTVIYQNCIFQKNNYQTTSLNFSTFQLQLPTNNQSECVDSAGYKLLQYYTGQGWEESNAILFPVYYIRDIFGMGASFTFVLVCTLIFYFFSKSISQFAADLTSGPMMSSVTASPTKLFDAAMSAAQQGAQIANALRSPGRAAVKPRSQGSKSGAHRTKTKDSQESKDSIAKGESDKQSSGAEKAADLISEK
jgi:type IV secretion system protein VirB6